MNDDKGDIEGIGEELAEYELEGLVVLLVLAETDAEELSEKDATELGVCPGDSDTDSELLRDCKGLLVGYVVTLAEEDPDILSVSLTLTEGDIELLPEEDPETELLFEISPELLGLPVGLGSGDADRLDEGVIVAYADVEEVPVILADDEDDEELEKVSMCVASALIDAQLALLDTDGVPDTL